MDRALVILGGGVGVAIAACTAILGDDFEISPAATGVGAGAATGGAGTATGGAGGATAAGGSAGGGGGPPPPALACSWELPAHEVAANLQGTSGQSWSNLFALRRDAQTMRVITRHNTSTTDYLEVFTVGNGPAQSDSIAGDRIHQVVRLDASSIGALYSLPGMTGPELRVRVISDGGSGSGSIDVYLENAFPGINMTASNVDNAMMVVIPAAERTIDFVAGYLSSSLGRVEVYGRHTISGGGANTVVITPMSTILASGQNVASAMAQHNNTSYAFLGTNDTREYVLDGTGAAGPPRSLAPTTAAIRFFGPSSNLGVTNFALVDDGPPLRMLIGGVDGSELGTFDPSQSFVEAINVPTEGDLYVEMVDIVPKFFGDIVAMVGYSPADNTLLRYQFIGMDGADRGQGDLPFTGALQTGEVRNFIDELAFEPVGTDFASQGGRLHVMWHESHTLNAATFDVLYYDRLRCDPVQ